jgi:hypothetical protein
VGTSFTSVAVLDNGDLMSYIGKHFSPCTITFKMAIGTEPSLSTGFKEELGAGEAGSCTDDSLIQCLGWNWAELRSAPSRRHNGVLCVEKDKFPTSPAHDIILAVWKASLNIGT